MKKIYCFNNGGYSGWLKAVAICEDGHCLAGHDGSTWKHENYDKHCGPGNWELEWVDNPATHEGLKNAFALNLAMQPPETSGTQPATV